MPRAWAVAVMLVKFWKLSAQQVALTYDVLPPDPTVKISPGNARLVEDHVRKLPVDPRKSFLINRVLYTFLLTETLATFVGISVLGGVVWPRANRRGALAS